MRENVWVKSSASANDSNCVEVFATKDGIRVRNSNIADSPEVPFTPSEWVAFIEGVRRGEFDWPPSA